MDEDTGIGAFRVGETLELVQRSARRREYELRRAGRAVGWLGSRRAGARWRWPRAPGAAPSS